MDEFMKKLFIDLKGRGFADGTCDAACRFGALITQWELEGTRSVSTESVNDLVANGNSGRNFL